MIRTEPSAYRAIRKKLLISCAGAALATAALAPQKVRAQAAPGAFQGTITSSTNASRTSLGAGTETITVTGSNAEIFWNPTGSINQSGNMVFLPAGNTATFQGDANAGNYTVLNRILPDGNFAIEFDGKVQSFVNGGTTGGNIWFYAPNGIVIGS
ncbi:MAG TPA: hypothetical protein VH392_07560, partial [Sphingomicrobium sp.]